MKRHLRAMMTWVKERIPHSPALRFGYDVALSLRTDGLSARTLRGIRWRHTRRNTDVIEANGGRTTERDYAAQRAHVFSRPVTFDLILPVLAGQAAAAARTIRSVRRQTYGGWRLFLVGEEAALAAIPTGAPEERVARVPCPASMPVSQRIRAGIEAGRGDMIMALYAADQLHPSALYLLAQALQAGEEDFLYTDEALYAPHRLRSFAPLCKPDFAPDYLRGMHYIGHAYAFSRRHYASVRPLDAPVEGALAYDLALRLTERAERVSHIPKNLYFRHVDRVDAYAGEAPEDGCRALSGHLERTGLVGSVSPGSCPGTYRVAYALAARPLVSILIPNKDAATVLRRCLDSIAERTTYPNYEVIVIENNSADASTFAYYDALAEAGKVHVIRWPGPFTFSEINNFGAKAARGDYLLFLNNDIEVITPDWIEQMLMYAQREDVGAVGAKLYYPDGRVQHAGVIVGVLGVGYHGFSGFSHDAQGYMCRLQVPVDLSAVTAACMLVRRNVFDEAEGFDPALAIAFNDVDLCLRIGEMRKRIVFTPYAEMYHHESYSRGSDEDTPEKHARFLREIAFFQSRWRKFLVQGDPYYHESLTLSHGGFFVEPVKRPYAAIFLREEGSDAGPA